MNLEELYQFCLTKKGAKDEFSFDKDALVFKVKDKIFAITSLKSWEEGNPSINLKCDPTEALALREQHQSVLPGFHMSKKHWNTVLINQEINDVFINKLISNSYTIVVSGLTKKAQQELDSEE